MLSESQEHALRPCQAPCMQHHFEHCLCSILHADDGTFLHTHSRGLASSQHRMVYALTVWYVLSCVRLVPVKPENTTVQTS